ncbi:uncharacterized protein LOC131665324 isoform X2 [Phymastichus coffea]|nr:uncharacterized protein LOC131665324 isoform X2 [Phymastichus coffea]
MQPSRCRIHLACPGSYVNLYKNSGDTSFCNKLRTTFMTNYDILRKFDLHNCEAGLESGYNVRCEGNITAVMKSLESRKRTEFIKFYAVGFELNLVDFLSTYYIMFDPRDSRAFPLAHSKIISIVEKRQKYDTDHDYNFGLIYQQKTVNFTDIYSKEQQMFEFERQIQNKSVIDKYFSNGNYLVRGQLISKDDFYYVSQQKTTAFYENTVPIWHSINDGNWKLIGQIVRKLADNSLSNFNIFVAPVNYFHIGDREIVLESEKNLAPAHPVYIPEIIVKVAVDSTDITRGVVFHTVNDPYTTVENVSGFKLPDKRTLCESYMNCHDNHPEFSNVTRGLTFCCTLQNSNVWEIVKEIFHPNLKFNMMI